MPSLEGSFLLLRLRLRPQREGLHGRLSLALSPCPEQLRSSSGPSLPPVRELSPEPLRRPQPGPWAPAAQAAWWRWATGSPGRGAWAGGPGGAWGRGWAWLAGLLRSPGDLTCLSRFFIGTSVSTFSFRIHEEREILGLDPKTTYNRFCGDEEKACEQPTHWRIAY